MGVFITKFSFYLYIFALATRRGGYTDEDREAQALCDRVRSEYDARKRQARREAKAAAADRAAATPPAGFPTPSTSGASGETSGGGSRSCDGKFDVLRQHVSPNFPDRCWAAAVEISLADELPDPFGGL